MFAFFQVLKSRLATEKMIDPGKFGDDPYII